MMNKKAQNMPIMGTVFIFVFIIGIFVCTAGFDQVDANHRGVMVKFGQVQGVMDAGIRWTGVFTKTHEYDLRIRQVKVEMLGKESATDNTGQRIDGAVAVNYRLKADTQVVSELYKNVGSDSVIAQRLNIEPIIKEGFKQATVQYEAMEILNNRQEVKELAKENIRNNFPEEYFEIVDIVVENIDFSEEFKDEIENKKIASQTRLKEEEMVNVVIAQQQQQIEVYKADAEKLRLQKAEITPLLVQKQYIEKWNGMLPIYMISSDSSNNMMMLLPDIAGGTEE